MADSNITGREPRLVVGQIEKGKRRLSLRRLGTMLNVVSPDNVSLDAVKAMIRSEDFFVRYNAAKLLGKRADRDARIIIEEALRDAAPRTRAIAARHMANFSWFAVEPLIDLALRDSDPRVRESAVYTLCDIRDTHAFNKLEVVLENEDDLVLEAAAFGLRETMDPRALPVLALVLRAKDPDVRIKGLEALGMSGLRDAMTMVREMMFDADTGVKYAATLSLLELAGEDWLQELSGVIGRTHGETLEQVLLAFFHATNYLKIDVAKSTSADLMIDALETALLDESEGVRRAAVWPLAWLRHERTPGILLKTYRLEQESDVKAHIVRVASSLMSDASEEILQDALASSDAVVKRMADLILQERAKAGGVAAQYDENAYAGEAFDRSHLTGRLS